MRIDLLAIGSQGDVQPCVALGAGLRNSGHDVRLVTLGGFERLVAGCRLDHLSLGQAPADMAMSAPGREWIRRRGSAIGFARGVVGVAKSLIQHGISTYWQARRGVDAIVVTPMGLGIGVHVAERLAVPMIRAAFAPTLHDGAGGDRWTVLKKDAMASVFRRLLWRQLRQVTNSARQRVLALPPLTSGDPYADLNRKRVPVLDAYSPAVVPSPQGCSEWLHVTGYWFLNGPDDWTPPPQLEEFLETGPAPVIVGFGSTPFPDPQHAADMVIRALGRTHHRGVVLAGGSGLPVGPLDRDVLSIEQAPHEWLFRRASAVVHHGGAGVTGAAVRAGLPSVVVPVFADQPFWASRLFELGVAAPPIPARRLTADALATALELTSTGDMRRRAAALGERVRGENGIARAIEAIHLHAGMLSAVPAGDR